MFNIYVNLYLNMHMQLSSGVICLNIWPEHLSTSLLSVSSEVFGKIVCLHMLTRDFAVQIYNKYQNL